MSYLVRSYGDSDFITGLRCIAATMVIMIHTGALRDFGTLGGIVTDNGKYGVQIFFVISGFTIARTWRAAGSFGPYFGRRLMRIAPLYYAIISLPFLLIFWGAIPRLYWMTHYDSAPDAYNLLMHLTFLSALDARVANSLIGVEWTIPIEVFWYAVLPLLLPLLLPVRLSRRRVAVILGALLLLSGLIRAAAHLWLPPHAAHFLPLTYGAYFWLGALAERLRPEAQRWPLVRRSRATLGAGALFVLGLATDTGFNAAILGLATAGLIVCRPGSGERPGFLDYRPMLFLGSISYSLYLLHFLALMIMVRFPEIAEASGVARFAVAFLLTTALSVLTYTLIEYPSNRLGRRWFGGQRPHPAPEPRPARTGPR